MYHIEKSIMKIWNILHQNIDFIWSTNRLRIPSTAIVVRWIRLAHKMDWLAVTICAQWSVWIFAGINFIAHIIFWTRSQQIKKAWTRFGHLRLWTYCAEWTSFFCRIGFYRTVVEFVWWKWWWLLAWILLISIRIRRTVARTFLLRIAWFSFSTTIDSGTTQFIEYGSTSIDERWFLRLAFWSFTHQRPIDQTRPIASGK